jgi:O-antigen ligase
MGVISILQYTGKNPFTLFPAGTCYLVSDLTRMFIGTVGNIDSTAGMSCIMLPIFFCSFILYRNRSRFFLLIPLLLNIFVLLFTGVQQGVVGLGAGLILMLPFVSNTVQRMRNTMVALGLIFLTAAFQQMLAPAVMLGSDMRTELLFISVFPSRENESAFHSVGIDLRSELFSSAILRTKTNTASVNDFQDNWNLSGCWSDCRAFVLYFSPAGKNPQHGLMYEGAQVLHGNMEESFGSNRFFVWKRVPALFRQYPVIGSGPDSFGPRFSAAYQQDMLIRFKKMLLFDHAENEYLSLLVNLGLIGLLLYLTLLGSQILRFLKMNKTTERIIFLSPLICASVQLFFTSSTIIVSPVFWIVWGLLNRSLRTPVVD